ncbi:MAG: hypothetical protein H6559_23265 [Lewinellaceae bacterium]|nr:hypothetical protein [Bacteroidota bacterium]MCB9294470.1 hypothetical protein [Lewinellaceae bacterium]MCB9296015.1 hypothetical protein [Lewinellaceae bacterium]
MEYYSIIVECQFARFGSVEKEIESLTDAIRLFNSYQGSRLIESPNITIYENDASMVVSMKLKATEFDDSYTVSILQEEFRKILQRKGHL